MRILLISFVFSPNLGGIETHLDDLVNYLSKRGHKIAVITYQPLISDRNAPVCERKHNLEIRRLPWIKFDLYHRLQQVPILQMLYLIPPIFLYSFLYLIKHKKNTDVIQVHGFHMAIVGRILSGVFSIPFVVNTHVSFQFVKGSLYSRILLKVLGSAKYILVLTKDAKVELVKIGISANKIILYHYWVDAKFKPLKQKKTGKFVALFVGRFLMEKGIFVLLEAARKLPEINFHFIGSGPLQSLVKSRAIKEKNIQYEGVRTKDDLPSFYTKADICVIPSLPKESVYTEGIPRVMIESFSCGLPVIATDVGGLKDYVTSSVGFIIQPNTASLVAMLQKLSRKNLRSMQANCLTVAQKEFALEKNAEIIERSLL